MTDIQELEEGIIKSFKAVKKDIRSIRESFDKHSISSQKLSRDLKTVKEVASPDKLNALQNKITTLTDDIAALKKSTDSLSKKDLITQDTFTERIDRINSKISDLNTQIKKVDRKKERVMESDIKKYTKNFNTRLEKIESNVSNLSEKQKKNVDDSQVKELLKDINKEFDMLKKAVSSLDFSSKIKSIEKNMISKNYLVQQLDSFGDDISDLRKELKKKVDSSIDRTEFNTEISQLKQMLAKQNNGSKSIDPVQNKTAKNPHTPFISTLFIIIGVIFIIAAIVSHFYSITGFRNIYAVIGIIVLIIGLIIKLYNHVI